MSYASLRIEVPWFIDLRSWHKEHLADREIDREPATQTWKYVVSLICIA